MHRKRTHDAVGILGKSFQGQNGVVRLDDDVRYLLLIRKHRVGLDQLLGESEQFTGGCEMEVADVRWKWLMFVESSIKTMYKPMMWHLLGS